MAEQLADGEFDLAGYVFGEHRDVFVEDFRPGTKGMRDDDTENPVGNNRYFGRDHASGPVWSFDLIVNQRTLSSGLTVAETLEGAWSSDGWAPGDEVKMRYCIDGRTRFAYGRPRRYQGPLPFRMRNGVGFASGEFKTSGPYTYDDEQRLLVATLLPNATGGLAAPLRSPLSTVPGGDLIRTTNAVGGTEPAPVILKFTGPVSNPRAKGDGWEVSLNTSLAYDQSITVDTRNNTVLRNDGTSMAGKLARGTRLPEVRLKPGATAITFGGADATGTATCEARWHPTYKAL